MRVVRYSDENNIDWYYILYPFILFFIFRNAQIFVIHYKFSKALNMVETVVNSINFVNKVVIHIWYTLL